MDDILGKNNIDFIIKDDQVMVKAKDIGDLLGIKDIRTTLRDFDKDEKIKLAIRDNINRSQMTHMLTEKGIKRLLCSSRKPMSVLLARELGINVQHKYVHIETTFVINIKKTFLGEEILEQYIVGDYILDLYFPKYNLAIEIDENAHKFKKNQDYIKEEYIRKKLDCKFLRIKEKDDIFISINLIYTALVS